MADNKIRISKDSRGFAPLLIVLLIVALVGAGGFAYWRISSYNDNKDTKGKTSSADKTAGTNTATLSKECVAQTGDENICHLGAIADLSNYASEVHMTMGEGEEANSSVIKFDGKGNHFIDAGQGVQGMSIGGHYYANMDGTWYDTGSDPSQSPKASVPSMGFATTAGIKYENLGKEPCGKDTCFHYKLTGGAVGDGVVTTLFGDKDYLPRTIDSTGGLIGKLSMTIEYKDITLTAPEGAKPISSLTGDLTGN
jgi:hypothetical protein